MSKDTGGPAFPCWKDEGGTRMWFDGMTLRDYFAAKAMEALINKDGPIHIMRDDGVTEVHTGRMIIPVLSYQYADAMLRERAK